MDELIIVYREQLLQAFALPPAAAGRAATIVQAAGGTLSPIFADTDIAAWSVPAVQSGGHYASAMLSEASAAAVATELRGLPEVETAYTRRQPENPIAPWDDRDRQVAAAIADLASLSADGGDLAIPDFMTLQGYLQAAPAGVGAADTWHQPGGRGDGVRVIDIEGGWCLTHVDLQPNDGLLGGTALGGAAWRDHGTAVLGVIAGTEGATGITGIAPGARVAAVSHGGIGAARAIEEAARQLSPGDLMLLEMHDAGPRFGFVRRQDQRGYIAMEWWPDIFIAIQRAVARGIVVIEAAGNGAEDLDDPLYDVPHPNFPAAWRNPFGQGHDSGAILVGAGAPPNGVFGADRSRLSFSNYGARLDCQGWGRSVVTTGYGDLFGGTDEDLMFTAQFSGTSSATPVVGGAVACLQGVRKAMGGLLTPEQARNVLRSTGSAQQDGPAGPATQRIGRRPDLATALAQLAA